MVFASIYHHLRVSYWTKQGPFCDLVLLLLRQNTTGGTARKANTHSDGVLVMSPFGLRVGAGR
jgi:hypothetical protein